MAQQTAVEWFMNQINQYTELEINHADGSKTKTRVIPPWIMQNLIEQAKQMEKQQHEQTWNAAHQAGRFEGKGIAEENWQTFKQYYNETYNSK